MKIVGCDLHATQQSIAMVDTETGEFTEKTRVGPSLCWSALEDDFRTFLQHAA